MRLNDWVPPIVSRRILDARLPRIDATQQFGGKVFCIGPGKTGTTSLESALRQFGYRLGVQAAAEMLANEVLSGEVGRLVRYCESADAFQDVPFFLPRIFEVLDRAYPGSRFILTVRDDARQWFRSLVRYHTKLYSSDSSRPPTAADLGSAIYRYRGYILETMAFWGYPEIALYDEDAYCLQYETHVAAAQAHFAGRPRDLLTLNVASPDAYHELGEFLNVRVPLGSKFPWENRT